ncbi:MAG: hypothetical protein HQL77_05210 [Magnetococcales bacterium]|nr:hypothetical protein [Magnetococcales bacterium]
MIFIRHLLVVIVACIVSSSARADEAAPAPSLIPRDILAFYNSKQHNGEAWFGRTHKFAEMPLNYLGLRVRYLDIQAPLPDPTTLTDVRGALIWTDFTKTENPEILLNWAIRFMNAGKRLVLFGSPPWSTNLEDIPPPLPLTVTFWQAMGFTFQDQWVSLTRDVEIILQDKMIVGFEHPLPKQLPGYFAIIPDQADVTPHLLARSAATPTQDHVLIATSPRGGFVAGDYALFMDQDPFEDHKFFQWIINPFEYFRLAFATDDLPKPDATTLSNRRIYYSHIDGDGLRNLTEVKPYNDKRMTVAEVILKEVIEGYPELPVTVAPVVGDLDPAWYGSDKYRTIAKSLFAPPQVEVGNHTLSHPLDWAFFEHYEPAHEAPYLKNYPERENALLSNGVLEFLGFKKKSTAAAIDTSLFQESTTEEDMDHNTDDAKNKESYRNYKTPRSYASKPFSLFDEIEGANRTMQQLLPANKTVRLLQWSGNTLPFQAALVATRQAKMANLNGGNTRFDAKFPSIAWIAPLGRQVQSEWQCYASASNENTYTNLWTDQFFGFKYLIHTVKNTETPRRLIPFNIYYHLYSGEKLASLNALKSNLDYARSQALAPVAASFYASIAEGAIQANLYRLPSGAVEIRNRGHLQTIRFDHATLQQVDFAQSNGIIGQRHFQGSLYVALDQAVNTPRIMIIPYRTPAHPPPAPQPYLLESRWRIFGLTIIEPHRFTFNAHGFGKGDMTWKVPQPGNYRVETFDSNNVPMQQGRIVIASDHEGLLRLTLPVSAMDGVTIVVSRQEP